MPASDNQVMSPDAPGKPAEQQALGARLEGLLRKGVVAATARRVGPAFRWWEAAAYGAVLSVAAVMRLWDLGARAMHHDESLHSFYSWGLANGSGYTHIPMMHGPFQFEANAAVFFIAGDGDYTARLLYALVGTGLVALPLLLRSRLGRLGSLLASVMLAFSPAMLYFSRFARNDILMAAWTLGLVICLWRYVDEGRNRYLYFAAALLALAFATKETAYLVTAILGLFLILLVTPGNWRAILNRLDSREASPLDAVGRILRGLWDAYRRGVNLSRASRPATFLILLVTLSLPLWSALIGVLQDTALLRWSNLVLAAPIGSPTIGAPSGGGQVIAVLVVLILLGLSVYWGFRWRWSVWWRCALIFYGVWVLLYTTFFTNFIGVGSGVWQSLGYWIVQQGEARGGQPWFYYFVITPLYEFLPLLLGAIATVYYLRKRDVFGHFLVFWAIATFILYSIASEKMPWLLVNVTLPLILLSSRFLADALRGVQWRRLSPGRGVLLVLGVPALLFLVWQLAFFEARGSGVPDGLVVAGLAIAAAVILAVGVWVGRKMGLRDFAAVALIPLGVVLLVLTVRAGWMASYRNGDVPVEMIVYTQTTPDIARLTRTIDETNAADLRVSVDPASGFSWPWAWYLRGRTGVDYSLPSSKGLSAPNSSVVLVHSNNNEEVTESLSDTLGEGARIRHRWWFPEETYRGLTLGSFLSSFGDRGAWRRSMNYFLYREGVRDRLGSEDAYLYISRELPLAFSPSP